MNSDSVCTGQGHQQGHQQQQRQQQQQQQRHVIESDRNEREKQSVNKSTLLVGYLKTI